MNEADDQDRQGQGGESRRKDKDEALISALLSEPSRQAAAAKAGVSDSTVTRRLADPRFRARFDEARRAVVASTVGRLQQVAAEAVEVLHDAMANEKAKDGDRIRAALGVLQQAFGAGDLLDQEGRLRKVEEALKERGIE